MKWLICGVAAIGFAFDTSAMTMMFTAYCGNGLLQTLGFMVYICVDGRRSRALDNRLVVDDCSVQRHMVGDDTD